MDREANDGRRGTVHAGHEYSSFALQGVCASLVHRFATGDVGSDLFIRHRHHLNLGGVDQRVDLTVARDCQTGENLMSDTLETP
jgi:hypothetical protein